MVTVSLGMSFTCLHQANFIANDNTAYCMRVPRILVRDMLTHEQSIYFSIFFLISFENLSQFCRVVHEPLFSEKEENLRLQIDTKLMEHNVTSCVKEHFVR